MPPFTYNSKGRKNKSSLPDPFRTYSSYVYPRTIDDVLIWASFLWERNPKYRIAIQKVISYFVSDLTVVQDAKEDAVDSDAINAFKDLLIDDYNMLPFVLQFGEELAAMGNVFVSAERIFTRELLCPTKGCGWDMRLSNLRKGRDYEWTGEHFRGRCPRCGKTVTWKIKDIPSEDDKGRRIRFVFRSAEDMLIQPNRLTGTAKYYYKMPKDAADGIKRGDPAYLEDSPEVFLRAANQPDMLIEFPQASFLAMRTHTLTNLDRLYRGWGVPLFMVAFDNIVRLQHLMKFNEAVVLDYLVPTRILSPAPQNLTAGIGDPNRMPMSGATWRNMMASALNGRLDNPTRWILSPVPVVETQVGGNKDVIPAELLEYETTQLLADMGIPQEFRQTNFQAVAPTMGLRMFEKQWVHTAKSLNTLVRWMADIIARAHNYEDMTCTLDMTSFVEDDMNKQIIIGMMQGNQVARTPVLKRLGIDYEDDLKMQMKEQQMQMDLANKQQTDQENEEMVTSSLPPAAAPGIGQAQMNIQMMQQQAQGGAAPAQPGAPAAPAAPAGAPAPLPFNQGASGSASIEQQYQEAQQMAQELYAAPPNIRRQQLVQLKANNPSMHAQVVQMMKDMTQQVASDAVAQSRMPQ